MAPKSSDVQKASNSIYGNFRRSYNFFKMFEYSNVNGDDFQIFEMIRDEKCDCPLPLTGKFCERAELVQVYLIAQLKCFTFGYLFVV